MSSIICPKCKEEIHSLYKHDFKTCKCGALSIDGGNDYMRLVGDANIINEAVEEMKRKNKSKSISTKS